MSFGTAYMTKKHNKKMCNGGKAMAEGGAVEEQKSGYASNEPHDAHDEYEDQDEVGTDDMKDADMIARIMHKRKMYSKGGQVANDVGVAEADKLPAEFDDMELDDHLEDDSGAGNEIGDDDVGDDPIDRIMLKSKKQHNPRPA